MAASSQDHSLAAAGLMIAAMAVIGVIDNYIAPLARHVGLWQFHLTRALFALPLVLSLSLIGLGRLQPMRLWAVALRSALVATSMLFYFTALAMMPIAEALAGLFTSPIFILLISVGALRQRIGIWRIFAVLLGFLGIVLVLQPDPRDFDVTVLIPICAGFFYALGAITTRSLCRGESTVALLAGMWITLGTIGALGSVALSIWPQVSSGDEVQFFNRPWVWPIWPALPLIVLQAVGSVVAVFMIIKAYQLSEPSYVSVFEYSVMIFGPLFAWIAFGQPVGGWQVLGIVCIGLAGTIIALRSR
ncbi:MULTISPECIES: DMT family transporter [unclassified Ruegeria]|uniref:DMT family transporter n=1 Tax=unclassified Ruegeria TaxID=2625375 RepID=UPI001487F5AD|nr:MULTISPECIES: DMT family transporter [unclassified Ruegeria]